MKGWQKVFGVLLVVLLIGYRFLGLEHMSLWIDEGASWWRIQKGIFTYEANLPPLYFLLAWPLVKGFGTDWALRLPAALAGAGSILAGAYLAKTLRINWRKTVLLLGLSPWILWYSQEARPYSLVMLLVPLAILAFLKGRTWLSGVLWGLALWAHYISGAPLVALWLTHWKDRKNLLKTTGVGLAIFTPWLLYSLTQYSRPMATRGPIEDILAAAYSPFVYFFGYTLGPSLAEIRLRQISPLDIGLVVLGFGVIVIALWEAKKEKDLLIWISVPVLLFLFLSIVHPKLSFHFRYAAVSGVFLIMAAAKAPWMRLAPLIILNLIADYNFFFNKKYFKEDIRAAASVIRKERKEGEPLLLCSGSVAPALERYYSPSPPYWGMNWGKALKELEGEKVWVLWARVWEVPKEKIRSTLDSKHYKPLKHWQLTNARVELWELTPAERPPSQ